MVREKVACRVPKDSALRWVFFAYTHFPAPVSGAKSPYLRRPRLPPFCNALTPKNLQNPIKRGTPLSDGYLAHRPFIRLSYIANYQSVAESASSSGERGPCKNEVTKYTFTRKPSAVPSFSRVSRTVLWDFVLGGEKIKDSFVSTLPT